RKFAKSLDFIGNDGKPVDSIKIYMGETGKVTTEVTPADAIDSEVKWSSADPSVASVDENTGDITPVKPGNVIITAATGRGKITKTLKVTIVAKVEKVEISYPTAASPSSVTAKGYINVGESAQLSAKVLPAEAVQDVTWTLTSQEADAATIDALGKVTAFKPGKFTVTASSKDNPNITSEAYEFTVFSPAQGLKIKAPNGNSKVIYVKRKGSVQLGRFISNLDCTDTFKFAASKKKRKIGTVTQDGLFKAKKKTGAVKVYLRSYSVDEEGKVLKQNAQTTITIKVVKKIKKVKRIRLTGSRTVNVNGTLELLAKPSPAKNVSCGARWTSSDESIATVDAYGVIRGIKAGTVKINLTGPNKNKVVIKVTVKGEP
ncbi:MAG: Ig-like domain-containing protein, partial [Lachnospiraceae bacterium]|nr:Ig-like domain-containing protein [Lachnospiraceae bacterium]MEE3461875.1 Ig-like domain-containing protein [Lachnospiraceae bacterium]